VSAACTKGSGAQRPERYLGTEYSN